MRPYTGYDRTADGPRAGVQRFVEYAIFLTGSGLWNNGTWGVRPKRGKQSMSVHATGRAMDLSWRRMSKGRGYGDYWPAKAYIDAIVANADLFDLEMVIDYYGPPHGQGWRCDRMAWQQYDRPTVGGAPGGDWFHLELGPRLADDPAGVDAAFAEIFARLTAG